MSANETFAALMWAWPGPVLKRDQNGRVVIVNAAFLQLYGGSVEDWHGNSVAGWPAPGAPGTSGRFESKIPQADGTEITYDWLECVMADGSAVTIARDVTAILYNNTIAVQNSLRASHEAELTNLRNRLQQLQTAEAPMPPVDAYANHTVADTQPATAAMPVAATATAVPAFEAPPVEAPTASFETPVIEQPQISAPEIETPMITQPVIEQPVIETPQINSAAIATPTQMVSETVQAEPVMTAPVEPAVPPVTTQAINTPSGRDFERRALPIEDGDAVLGNNWRDAVIAKAVGLNDAPAEQAVEPAPAQIAVPETSGPAIQPARILLAEDNAINALLTRTLLEAEGCIVEVVEDGQLAVEAVKNANYDMIFMDMRMPNMDGLEATRKIRAMDHGSKGLPIVALTANAFDDDRNACFDSGMNDFMTKPVSAEELSQMVKTHTGYSSERLAS